MREQRNSNIELLRFILMVTICILHMFMHGFGINNIGHTESINYIHLMTCVILIPPVNSFMLISGFYGIKFSIHKMLNFIIQASFYFWLCILLKYIIWNSFNISELIHIFPIATKAWWFLTEYFIIFLLSSIINNSLRQISQKQFLVILITLIFINSFGLYITRNSLGSNLLSLLIIYLIGRYCALYNITISRKKSIILWTSSTIALGLVIYLSTYIDYRLARLLLHYNNPLIILQAIGILYFFLSFTTKHYQPFILLGSHCFAIYLITERLGIKLYSAWSDIYNKNIILAIICIFIVCFACIYIDIIQVKINQYLQEKILKKIKI